jgi:hypothetical protein
MIAPYGDGFALVQALRERGGWEAVDAVYRTPPESTEQVLHLDKLDAREPPIAVAAPPGPDEGWERFNADVMGEHGLRMMLEQWVSREAAAAAAAGWGGDRYAVHRRASGAGSEWAVAWYLRFDTTKDAAEAEATLARHQPSACSERAGVGPFARRRSGDALALVAGPYLRLADGTTSSASNCAASGAWLARVLATR